MCVCLYVGIWIFRHCKCPLGGHTPLVPLKVTTSAMSSYAFAYTSCISLFGPMSAQICLQVFPMYALTKSTHTPCIFLSMYLCPFVLSGCVRGCTLHGCFVCVSVRLSYENGLCMYQQPLRMYVLVCMHVHPCMHARQCASTMQRNSGGSRQAGTGTGILMFLKWI